MNIAGLKGHNDSGSKRQVRQSGNPKNIDFLIYMTSKQFFTEVKNTIFNLIWKHKILRVVKTTLNNKRPVKGITIPDFKLC